MPVVVIKNYLSGRVGGKLGHSSRPIQSGAAVSKSMRSGRATRPLAVARACLQGTNRGGKPTKEWGIDAFFSRFRWVLRVSRYAGTARQSGQLKQTLEACAKRKGEDVGSQVSGKIHVPDTYSGSTG